MPDINEHMDELFQKAGKLYPLKTSSANFDKVQAALAEDAAPVAATKPAGRKRYLLLLLLGFILGAGTISIYIFSNNMPGSKTVPANAAKKKQEATPTTGKQYLPESLHQNVSGASTTTLQTKLKTESVPVNSSITLSVPASSGKHTLTGTTQPIMKATPQQPLALSVIAPRKERNALELSLENIPATTTTNATTTLTVDELLTGETSAVPPNADAGLTQNKKSAPKQSIRKKLFFGLTAGVEFNQIKQQGITRPSLNAGLLLGWQVTSKFAIESGLIYTEKKYYSKGKYFTPKSGSMPGGMQINSLNSKVTMLELPLNVKYDLWKNWYARAGLSSYLMTKEENKYDALMYGQPEKITSTYNKNKTYLASLLNIGAGYQQQLNKKHTIRIEPYVQIPLKGMGIGYMPVTSAGLHIIIAQ